MDADREGVTGRARRVAAASRDAEAAAVIGELVGELERARAAGCADVAHLGLGEALNRVQNEVASLRRQVESEYARGVADGRRDVKVRIELQERGALERAEAELAEVRRELAQFGRQLAEYERREREDR